LEDLARDVRESGVRDIVLLGMGGSSLAPEVFSRAFPAASGQHFFVLDSTDPASIQEVESSIDLAHTLFIVASKSGKTIETLSQFFYFHRRLTQAGVRSEGRSFLAITDRGSYLDHLADEYNFRLTFRNFADIGGRYSALSYFGLVPAALWGVDVAGVLDRALHMAHACASCVPAKDNPGVTLGAVMGELARQGRDKVTFLVAPPIAALAGWLEQLIAASTGKAGTGLLPVADEPLGDP